MAGKEDSLPQVSNGSTGPKGIPIEKILDCRAKGLTLIETAKLCDCSEANIVKRIRDAGLETIEQFNAHRVSIYDLVEKKHLEKVLDGDSKRPIEDMTIAAIAGDKGRLIRGQATSIVETRSLTIDLSKAYEAMRQSVDKPVDNSSYQPDIELSTVQAPDIIDN